MPVLTRRHILRVAAASTLLAFPGRVSAAPRAVVQAIRTIVRDPTAYLGWPTLARRHNGQLLLVYSGGRESHVCPFGRVELVTSNDLGATWTYPRVILDSAIDDRDAGVLETAKGSILVTTFTSLAYQPVLERAEKAGNWPAERLDRWRRAHARLSDKERQADLGEWMLRSTDSGLTFSARFACPVNSPHGPIQLGDGRLLYAGKELWHGQRRNGVCESADDGATWAWLATIPTRPGDDPAQYHELHAVEAADRSLIVHIRNENKTNFGETLQCESADGGKTWTVPHAIGVWGLPSHLLRLKDDRLLMTYGHRRPPFGNQARLSEDRGRTWSDPLTISADGASGDLGYPSTVQLDSGSLVTVWYELPKDSPRAVLRQAEWSIEL